MNAFLTSLVLVGAIPTIALSQTCNGTADFAAGPVRVGAGGQFAEGAKAFGAEVAFGTAKGAFGGMNVSTTSYENFSESVMSYGGHAGFAVPVGASQKLQMCPMISFGMTSGPDIDTGFGVAELSSRAFGLGLSLGGVATSSSTFDFVPFASIAYYHTNGKASLSGVTETSSDDVGGVSIGSGFVLNKTVTLLPYINFPLGVEEADPSFGVSVSLNLGAKR